MRLEPPLRPGVLFDVDGTLVDSNYLHALAWSRALHDAGEWAPMNAIHRLIGMGGDQLVSRLLGHESKEAVARRPERYRELVGELRAFPGATSLLRRCQERGLGVVLATSSPGHELEAARLVLTRQLVCESWDDDGAAFPAAPADLDGVVDGQTCADDVERSKPDPDVFLIAMGREGLDPRRTVAVGDSVWDVEAAAEAGIGCVGVESGGFSRHELSEAGAIAVYKDVENLFQLFEVSPLAQLG